MTRAVIYTRISHDALREGLGVERQRDQCLELCELRGWGVEAVYEDNDISASTLSSKPRPAYEAMLAAVRDGEVDVVVAYSNSRLTRRPLEWMELIRLANSGILKIATVASGTINLATADGRAIAITVAAWDAAEAERTSERVKAQQLQYATSGKKHQGRFRMFGYTRAMRPHPVEADYVREVFRRKAHGESMSSIARDLNARGILTSNGGYWDASMVSKVLARHDYVGEIAFKGKVVAAAVFEPLVDRVTFDLARQNAQRHSNWGHHARVSLLVGFLVCGTCHTKMRHRWEKGRLIYKCPGPPRACGSCAITGKHTDRFVLDALYRKHQHAHPAAIGARDDVAVQAGAIEKEIEHVRRLHDAQELALVDYLDTLSTSLERLAQIIGQRPVYPSIGTGPDWVRPFADVFGPDEPDPAECRRWIQHYVDHIVIAKAERRALKGYKPGRVTIHYQDGTVEQLRPRTTLVNRRGEEVRVRPRCSVQDCEGDTYAKGMCPRHYKAANRKTRQATVSGGDDS